ncbi:AraC family transcriptional regulator [Denitrobaculum tricleocarpae]|uniref:AraC family transcriptional regulator n=1 Tax=Denitrobaculum tricleocarpae TaxID=2591009 RepID=A0A545TFU0_9PROT|nr:AraC family transcriptional regulator [Denitrobaculum tricleocarpae]TQV76097.1 AraC family transcriptional regulator [Denitrobaculum tricleocarpae]
MSEETRRSSEDPDLFPWLSGRSLTASVFFSGSLCGTSDVGDVGAQGHLHLLRRGPLRLHSKGEAVRHIEQPSLILFSKPRGHRLEAEGQAASKQESEPANKRGSEPVRGSGGESGSEPGSELVCARLSYNGPEAEFLMLGLPDPLIVPLDALAGLGPVLERLFDEAFTPGFGQRAAVDLILELLIVMLLRHCIARGLVERGLLAGLADPKLARSLAAMHADPAAELNIEALAGIAGMSRSNFAAAFKQRVGASPGDYLTALRLELAKQLLLRGRPLKAVAPATGYQSATALARAFQRRFGCAPRAWLTRQRAED